MQIELTKLSEQIFKCSTWKLRGKTDDPKCKSCIRILLGLTHTYCKCYFVSFTWVRGFDTLGTMSHLVAQYIMEIVVSNREYAIMTIK